MKRVLLLAAMCVGVCGCFDVNVKAPDLGNSNGNASTANGGKTGLAPSQLPLSGSWKDVAISKAGEIFLDTQQGVLFYAYDSLAYPNQEVELGARLQNAAGLGGIQDVELAFTQNGRTLGKAKTDESGIAKLKWTPPQSGDYPLKVRIVDVPDDEQEPLLKLEPAPLLVSSRPKGTPMVVIDLDHTVVDASFFRVLVGGATPAPDSVRVTRRLAGDHTLVYLTQRPDLLVTKSKLWLQQHDYPAGPLLVSGIRELVSGNREYKAGRLSQVMKSYQDVRIGIGDKVSDAQVYLDAGLTAYLLPYYKQEPKDMLAIASQIEQLGESSGKGKLQVVRNWREIEAGVYDGKQFPADTFARRLRDEARQLQPVAPARQSNDDDDD